METSLKFSICTVFVLLLSPCFSQPDKEKILANFDYVEYYPDSTIRTAHKFTGATLTRFTVEFNEVGIPVAMGNYYKGVRRGIWIYSNGSSTDYTETKNENLNPLFVQIDFDDVNKRSGSTLPGCGTGTMQAIQHFREEYQSLLNPESDSE
jgi:hypothetical protein